MTSLSQQLPLVIWGASGHAIVVADIVRNQGAFHIVGFIDSVNPKRHGDRFCESTILGGIEQLDTLRDEGIRHILLGFGDCNARLNLTHLLQAQGFILPITLHPRSIVAEDVVIGPGTVIMAGAVVNPGVQIGSSVIVNTSASIDHECVIGDAAHISPGVRLAGRVRIGCAAHIGIGATVIERISIGDGAVVGAGAVVLKDIPAHVVAYGVPAKVRTRINF